MEYKKISERINTASDIKNISQLVCKSYNIGDYVKHKIVEIGYEDFNVILDTSKGRYFMKILNNARTDDECYRLANIYYTARKNGVNVPKIYKKDNELILVFELKNVKLRILLMEYINGKNIYELERGISLEEIREIAYQAAKINKIDFSVDTYYDEWTVTNFKNEYEKKFNSICEEDKKIVNKIYKEFIKLNLDNLPKAYIHGDIINTNLIKSNDKIWIIDFSVLNYLPRVIELAVIVHGICIYGNRKDSIKRLNYFLNMYHEKNNLTKSELDVFNVVLNTIGAMNVMQASYIKAMNQNFEENQYWLNKGKEVINLNLRKEEIDLL